VRARGRHKRTPLAPAPEARYPRVGLQGFTWPWPNFSWASSVSGVLGVFPGWRSHSPRADRRSAQSRVAPGSHYSQCWGRVLAAANRSATSPAMPQALSPAPVGNAASHGSASGGPAPQSWLPQHPKTHCPCHAASGSKRRELAGPSLLIARAALAFEES